VTLTLRARLTAVYSVIFGVLLVGLSLISYRVLARQLDADATARLVELTDGLHGYLRFANGIPRVAFDATDSDQAAFIHEATRYYQIYDANAGRLVVQSSGLAPLGLHFTPAEVQTFRTQPRPFDMTTEYGRFRISNNVISSAGQVYLLQVGISLAAIDGALHRYMDLLRWRVPGALVMAAIVTWWVAGVALRPLSRFAVAAAAIDVISLSQRLPVRGIGDELDKVGRAFNETLGRLEDAVGEMRQFSAALAHELRTPLTALRGEIELTMRRAGSDEGRVRSLASQLEEIDRLTRLIDRILTLARAESGQIHLEFSPVDLDALVASLVEQLEPIAQARDVDLRYERSGAAVVVGDAGWLQRLLLNLIDNSLKFTPAGGSVSLRVSREDSGARLEVRDTGIGMTPEVTERVFERFFRADPARPSAADGAGLGLSLVKWIVTGHHGRIAIDSRPGEGSTFTVWLPRPHGSHQQHLS
jgi:heavy metal sensor kinase